MGKKLQHVFPAKFFNLNLIMDNNQTNPNERHSVKIAWTLPKCQFQE